MNRQTDQTSLIDGPPRLAIEVLSPSDKLEEIHEKVHRRGIAPVTFNCEQRLDGGDVLPGFDIAVKEIFGRETA